MFGLREAGVVGASVAVAGAVAYLAWNYASSRGEKKPETRPGQDGRSVKEEESEEEERREDESREEEREERREDEREERREDESREEEREERREDESREEAEAEAEQSVVFAVAAEAPKASESRPVEARGTQVLVLGLDGAGKTSLLHCLSTGSLEQGVRPTQGFSAVSISRGDLQIDFLEIGGKEELRPYWQRYLCKALLLVFVVDSSDPQLFPVAKRHLHELLTSDPHLPLMVLAHKQDLPGACSITDLHDALSLSEVGDRRLFLIGTHVQTGKAELSSGVQDARDLIIQMVCEGR